MKVSVSMAAGVLVVAIAGVASRADGVSAADGDKPITVLKYGDGKADGKKSIAGAGEMIQFSLPDSSQKLRGLRVHCARYGYPKAPDEDVEITVVTTAEEDADIIETVFIPYAKFKRGDNRWTTIKFEEPVEVTESFWVILNFNAERTKGVYVSFDTSTEGQYSRIGLPGTESEGVDFGGDWMIQALLTKPE